MAPECCQRQDSQADRTQGRCQQILVLTTADEECNNAGGHDEYQKQGMKVFFFQQTSLHNREQCNKNRQDQTMSHTGA